MADTPVIKQWTVDDLMALGEDARVEIIDGELVEMSPVGGTHHFIAGNVFRALDAHVTQNDLGYVVMDGLIYLLDAETEHLRGAQVPDVSYIRKSSFPKDWQMDAPFPGAPDLAIEVVSPNDDPEMLMIRVERYLEFGTEEVWVLYPKSKTLQRYRRESPDTVEIYRDGDMFAPETLFSDLSLSVRILFTLPQFPT